jgi:hypothetical protein
MIIEFLERVKIPGSFWLFSVFESKFNSRKNRYKFRKLLISIDPNFSLQKSINHKLSTCEISLNQHDKDFSHEDIVVFLHFMHNQKHFNLLIRLKIPSIILCIFIFIENFFDICSFTVV